MGRGNVGKLPIRQGSHAHRLLALAGPEPTSLDVLGASIARPLSKTLGEAQLLAAQGYLRLDGRARARGTRHRSDAATCTRTPEGERALALLGPV